ncbi:TlpA disulfide reductase family protein [Flavitalea sp. BT771]|uniref:peroxiredoxin family protein n=1 Tax=Flavitalea sp. BT771 TaxID=3063329 RepID=UPI0026E1656C|nr:TlpA disulfide reductase family protein [Flavitalea sp. BT771]MDO6429840.1 TlpA disulfide reductase family protein [Flavitalea sp. BT771]MDV6218032.1 TlpA disulfide reductase family protein [Flavitalea sp. BT771]
MVRVYLGLILLLFSCSTEKTFAGRPGLPNGQWRAVLQRKDGHSIVFNFESKDSAGKKVLYIRNAAERLLVDNIGYQGDSVLIRLPFFESQLRAVVTPEGNLRGVWLKRGADNYQVMPFEAAYNNAQRFAAGSGVPKGVAGRWRAVFRSARNEDSSLRVGEFQQEGDRVTGTFLDPTGDFRYLEGVMDGDSLRLSCFDGGHAFYFTARLEEDGKLSGGQYFSGAAGYETWTAVKDASAALPDEFTLTKWNKDAGPLAFTFKDIGGRMVSLSEKRFSGKVVLIQIMGSWCPNCMDETRFLSAFYNEYHPKGVEIIGLAYERTTDFARSQASLRSFQQRFQVKYPMLITGVAVGDPRRAEKTLPQLQEIVGFPTTIFLDKTGKISRIHTGFSGPGTGNHYEEQQQEIRQTVDELLKN